MKSNALKILANKEGLKPKALYEALLQEYSKEATTSQVYHYGLGFTGQKLENLTYEMKKMYGISDKEIALYRHEKGEKTAQPAQPNPTEGENGATLNPQEKQIADIKPLLEENPILAQMPEEAKEGLKLRDEYPFLNRADLPDEFKILVADKIRAYNLYAGLHAEALQASTGNEAAEKLYELAKEAIGNYTVNQEIKAELDYFRDSDGKILGKHEKLADLKLQQDVNEMSEADLLQGRTNGQKSINKYKDDKEKQHLYEYHLRKFELITERLQRDFNRTFEKK